MNITKIKKLVKKSKEVPDKLLRAKSPRYSPFGLRSMFSLRFIRRIGIGAIRIENRLRKILYRTLRKSRSAFLRTHFAKSVKRLARMEVGRALRLFIKFTHFQLTIRPRIRLVAAVVLTLIFALIGANKGVDTLRAKEPEIKVNGQAILVADRTNESIDAQTEIDAAISYKKSPFNFKKPVEGYISQGFRPYHKAVDIATGAVGVPIKPLGEGKVEFTGYLTDGKGNVVVVDHGEGLKSLYAHMGQIQVGVGNEVNSETVLGTVGLTGRTTGAHVHVELSDNSIAVDPSKVLPD